MHDNSQQSGAKVPICKCINSCLRSWVILGTKECAKSNLWASTGHVDELKAVGGLDV